MSIVPPTRIVVFRLVIHGYFLYVWPTIRYHEMQFSITDDMTNEELRWRLCKAFDKDRNSKIKVYKLCYHPKHVDIIAGGQYMPQITDVAEYMDSEIYIVEFFSGEN